MNVRSYHPSVINPPMVLILVKSRNKKMYIEELMKISCGRKWQPTLVFLPEEPGGLQSMGLQRVGHD